MNEAAASADVIVAVGISVGKTVGWWIFGLFARNAFWEYKGWHKPAPERVRA